MKKLIKVCVLLFLCSCASRRHAELNKQVELSRFKLAQNNKVNKQLLYFKNDSNYIDAVIEIWPKGKFSYSPTEGFTGEANLITVNKKETAIARALEKKEKNETKNLSFDQSAEQKNQIKVVEAKHFSFILPVIFIVLLLIGFVWYKFR